MSGIIVDIWLKDPLSKKRIGQIDTIINMIATKSKVRRAKLLEYVGINLEDLNIWGDLLIEQMTHHEVKDAFVIWLNRINQKEENRTMFHWRFNVDNIHNLGIDDPSEEMTTLGEFSLEIDNDPNGFRDYIDWLNEEGTQVFFEEKYREYQYIIDTVGYLPASRVSIFTFGSPIYHKVLGNLALYIANEFDGLINMGGAVQPVLAYFEEYLLRTPDWIHEFVQQFPGKIWNISLDDKRVHHVIDREFMQAWLKHPGFRMCRS